MCIRDSTHTEEQAHAKRAPTTKAQRIKTGEQRDHKKKLVATRRETGRLSCDSCERRPNTMANRGVVCGITRS
eukprot:2104336-Pleurochrysis_carterae.AAC.1